MNKSDYLEKLGGVCHPHIKVHRKSQQISTRRIRMDLFNLHLWKYKILEKSIQDQDQQWIQNLQRAKLIVQEEDLLIKDNNYSQIEDTQLQSLLKAKISFLLKKQIRTVH
jgi:hypothetical protein